MRHRKTNWCGFWTEHTTFNISITFCIALLELMVAFSPIGFFALPPISITTGHIVVMIAALWGGAAGGAFVGGIFGLCSMWKAEVTAMSDADLIFAPFRSGHPFSSLLLSVGTRVLFGAIAGLLFMVLLRRVKKHVIPWLVGYAVVLDRIHAALVYTFMDLLFDVSGVSFLTTFKTFFSISNIIVYVIASVVLIGFYYYFNSTKAHIFFHEWLLTHEDSVTNKKGLMQIMIFVSFFICALLVHLTTRVDMILEIEGIVTSHAATVRFINVLAQYFLAMAALFILLLLNVSFSNKKRDLKFREEKTKAQAQLEQALQKTQAASEAKSNFLLNVSHDIRTPMNAIVGFTELVERNLDDPDKARVYLKKIRTSNDFLISLINDVLEMTRIESGKVTVEESYWNVALFNDTIFSVFDTQFEEKGVKFTRSINVVHEDVLCDAMKLRQIFLNVMGNALKYTLPGGSVSMRLVEKPCDKEGYALYQTEIEDTGIGISAEFLPHIFENFSREKNTTESKITGTGLGMPIVKRLCELLGGSVTVESRLGKGTKVTISIPHKVAQKKDIVDAGQHYMKAKARDFSGKRILLAEDNELNAEIAVELLNEAGFEVDVTVNGQACVEQLLNKGAGYYDLILMDIQMPVLNGYDATRKIRKLRDLSLQKIPVIAMTANAFVEDKQAAVKAGMDGHVAKPIDVGVLLDTIDEVLNRK